MRWLLSRIPRGVAALSLLMLLALILLAVDALCYAVTLPLEIDVQGGTATLYVNSRTLSLGRLSTPVALQFAPHDPVIHEYQIDGTDSNNNLNLSPTYFKSYSMST